MKKTKENLEMEPDSIKTVLKVVGTIVDYTTLDGVKTVGVVLQCDDTKNVVLREFHRLQMEKAEYGNGPGQWKFLE